MAFASVVLERLTGFVALPLLVFLGFALSPSLEDHSNAWIALLIASVTLGILGILLFVAGHPRIAGRFRDRENWTRFIAAVHQGIDRLRRDPGQIFPILGTAMLYQSSVVVMFALIFRALDLPVPIAAAIAFSPAVLMLQVLPISLSGLGIREGALVLFLRPFLQAHDLPTSRAIAAGLLWYGCMLVVSMFGAPAFAVGQRHHAPETHATAGDTDRGARVSTEVERRSTLPGGPGPERRSHRVLVGRNPARDHLLRRVLGGAEPSRQQPAEGTARTRSTTRGK